MKNRIIIALGLGFAVACVVMARWDSRLHTTTLGDGEIRYKVASTGTPAVIFEAGLGMDLTSFDLVFDDVAAHTQVFAYDRPGYGGSSRTSRPRTIEQAVDDLRRLLELAAVEPPFVLVGHSLGGIYMLNFAYRFPAETAGVVLVDVPHPEFFRRLRDLGVESRVPDKRYWSYPEFVRGEYDSVQDAELSGDIGEIPLIVMTSGDVVHNAVGPMVRKMNQELLELSRRSRHVFAENSSHMMLDDVPELVIECILDLVGQAREQGGVNGSDETRALGS